VSHRLIERYFVAAVGPYTAASLVLLTSILFVQQIGRYFETILRGVVPPGFTYQLGLALLPSVLVFTIPMAVLSGTIIGLGRMGSDSELVAMRAAGISTWKMLWPVLLLGAVATAVNFELNLQEAPRAQEQLRAVGLRAALYKLDSPVEPRTFATEIPGYVIYVRDGDLAQGEWGRVFIHAKDDDGSIRVITAHKGRIDSSKEQSELVLQDAVQTKLPPPETPNQSYVVERLQQLRILFNTGRNELLTRVQKPQLSPDEMRWNDLRKTASQGTATETREAQTVLHKRLALSVTPLLFSLLGAAVALRLRRGSRGFGVLLSLVIMLVYYLVTLAGDQLARAGSVPASFGAWLSTALTLAFAIALLAVKHLPIGFVHQAPGSEPTQLSETNDRKEIKNTTIQNPLRWLISFPALLDLNILRLMVTSFLLGFIALVGIFNIFTVFELWRFISANGADTKLVAQYLFYLLPLVSVELFPGSILVAALITYALIARRREAVAWWATGQSVYRLMAPGLAFAIFIAAGSWFIQEGIMPRANITQDNLRARIRGGPAQLANGLERRWLVSADGSRIYAYDFDESHQVLRKPEIYEFDARQTELRRLIFAAEGKWSNASEFELSNAEWINLDAERVTRQSAEQLKLSEIDSPSVFRPTVDRPSQLDSQSLRRYITTLKERGAETATFAVALQRKYAGPFSVIVMALIGMPLAISLGRKSTVVALCSAVAVSLGFWLVTQGFLQMGEHAVLPPAVAAWAPIVIFAGGGLYVISRVRT
jgi:LPS export ABC transporter permease LptG/LPS export ABC transporter permease LptF